MIDGTNIFISSSPTLMFMYGEYTRVSDNSNVKELCVALNKINPTKPECSLNVSLFFQHTKMLSVL